MKKLSIIIILALVLSLNVSPSFAIYGVQSKANNCTANQAIPDSECTPGAILTTDVRVVCVTGYTKKVRAVSTSLKKKVFAEYGIAYSKRSKYEVDHLISLELGGSNDISNLWPEPLDIGNGAKIKDKFENSLHDRACKGKITLKEAQEKISKNWMESYISSQQKNVTAPVTQTPKKDTPKIEIPIPPPSPAVITPAPVTTPPPPVIPAPVYVPAPTPPPPAPVDPAQGATARCGDGTYSHSTSRSGTCSHHGGVAQWL